MEKKKVMDRCMGLLIGVVLMTFISACSSNPKVSRVDAGTQTDLSGYWNDTDVRIVCDSLIKGCLDSPRVLQATAQGRGGIFARITLLILPFSPELTPGRLKPSLTAQVIPPREPIL